MKTEQIRKKFLEFFVNNNHQHYAPSSVIPDPSLGLLFTNAGMNQFRDRFTSDQPERSIVSIQPCIRAGGKHNDLDQVGHTSRHHTLFEMLGNFSFGEYGRTRAIQLAWEFLTVTLGISPNKLWVTVYYRDTESLEVWKSVGVAPERTISIGDRDQEYDSDNFWSMGATGPCGPCTEIFYDHGPTVSGGLPGQPDQDGDRYTEVWNIVFMQYNRTEQGLELLPTVKVDTGIGLERLAAVMQGVVSNYETDQFVLLKEIASKRLPGLNEVSYNVIADHMRAAAVIASESVQPSNTGTGYVLRKLVRRSIAYAGTHTPKLGEILSEMIPYIQLVYPQVDTSVIPVIAAEEAKFANAFNRGLKELAKYNECVPAKVVFDLHATHGIPPEIVTDYCMSKNLAVDVAGYKTLLEQHREISRNEHRTTARAS